MAELRTERLLLRHWRDDDAAAFAALSADPEVMRWYPRTLSADESTTQMATLRRRLDENGFGLWAVELPGREPLLGFVGIQDVPFEAPFGPAIEVGWRLARRFWGAGYATEGARAALAYGFDRLGRDEIVAMTVPGNARSRRVMERTGMHRQPEDDFDHPRLEDGHPLRRHVLYRLKRSEWQHAA